MALLVAIIDATNAPPQQVDRRVFEVVTGASAGSHSVYVRVADQLPGVADRSSPDSSRHDIIVRCLNSANPWPCREEL